MKRLAIVGVLLLVMLLIQLQPWQRLPVVLYEPLIYPVEVIKGDRIIFSDNKQLEIQHDMTINSMDYKDGAATLNSTRYLTLWELIGRTIKN